MTDTELVDAIRMIIRTQPRMKQADRKSAEMRDLARYDQIVGLVARHAAKSATALRRLHKKAGPSPVAVVND